MKILAGWVVVLAMMAGIGAAILLNVKPHRILAEERCVGVSCWPATPAAKHRPAQQITFGPHPQSPLIGQPESMSQAGRIDRSRKADRITVVVPATEAVLPPACEPPFSPLAKLESPNFIARCLT